MCTPERHNDTVKHTHKVTNEHKQFPSIFLIYIIEKRIHNFATHYTMLVHTTLRVYTLK